ncbi:MAG: putative DNA binding domain-containing protein [Lentimicrobiaceae bacterium]|nr:putative DNA binding domain-containing protein [Lentimicrobiaceae bacterium]
MRAIDKILANLEKSIKSNVYSPVETGELELKDLSGGEDWQELYKTICAFLNTKGGIIIIGIKEDTKNKCFKFTGFSLTQSIEDKIKNFSNLFTDKSGASVDLSDFISNKLVEIKPFLDGNVCLVFVENLPEDKKFVYYKSSAYERQLSGDHRINDEKIQKQDELIDELRSAVELNLVPETTLDDLDVDQLNDFIIRLNADKKLETLKSDIPSALSFLNRKKFIRNNTPTLLGMLVCGKNIFDHLGGKCELDAYFEMLEKVKSLADDQKLYKDNIIPLMESAWTFAFSKINVGVSVQYGGSAIYDYPEEVIRETINNALAHRDYTINRCAFLRIKNNEFIEIRNPGRFRQEQILKDEGTLKLRRIIPIPKAQNANLADVLKVYKRWEGRGIGMATLTNFALNNQIDIPYYRIYSKDEIGLFIPKGKVLDGKTANWLKIFDKYIKKKTNGIDLTEAQQTVLAYIYKSEKLNAVEKYTVNLSPDNNHFDVINDLCSWNLIKLLPQSTPEIQLFGVDSILKKEDFTAELRMIFGGEYDTLSLTLKKILQAIYLHSEYSMVTEISANLIGNFLYVQSQTSPQIDLKEFGNFKRKVRTEINKLERKAFIVRKSEGRPNYAINKNYQRTPSLFD